MDDGVVIARIESNLPLSPGLGHGLQHVQGLVAIEGGDFYSQQFGNLHQGLPERPVENHATDGRLQVEAHQGNDVGHLAGMIDEFPLGPIGQSGQGEQSEVVTQVPGHPCFPYGLGSRPDNTGNQNRCLPSLFLRLCLDNLRSQLQHRLVQTHLWIVDGKLSRVYTHRQPPGPGIQVVTSQGSLMTRIDFQIRGQGQRVRGNHTAVHESQSNIVSH